MDAVEELARIETIAREAEEHDGAAPLDEATWLRLRHHADDVRRWVHGDGFALVTGDELALVVRPSARQRGLGRLLLEAALPAAPPKVRAWSHVDHPGATALAAAYSFERVRELWVMRRSLSDPLVAPGPAPDGVVIRSFRAGDEAELLRVNAAAFAHHPEQGSMDAAQLAERMAEPWFDPSGLFVADAGDGLLGFHWTKQHSPSTGEVYVVGIDPAAQGRGLGRLLTHAGLEHLAARGVEEVLLYVESDNLAGIALYTGLGFGHAPADTHVQYERTL